MPLRQGYVSVPLVKIASRNLFRNVRTADLSDLFRQKHFLLHRSIRIRHALLVSDQYLTKHLHNSARGRRRRREREQLLRGLREVQRVQVRRRTDQGDAVVARNLAA